MTKGSITKTKSDAQMMDTAKAQERLKTKTAAKATTRSCFVLIMEKEKATSLIIAAQIRTFHIRLSRRGPETVSEFISHIEEYARKKAITAAKRTIEGKKQGATATVAKPNLVSIRRC